MRSYLYPQKPQKVEERKFYKKQEAKTDTYKRNNINYQTMAEASFTTLIAESDDELQGDMKCSTFVDGGDRFFYGIPFSARRVVKFNPLDKSLTKIGPDLGEGEYKCKCGVRANNGRIYCAPWNSNKILKIDTNDGTVETLDNVELPETGNYYGIQEHLHQTVPYTTCLPVLVAS